MANISLLGSIQTCKVDTGWANKIQSARFQDPALMICPPPTGYNHKGQKVCKFSFNDNIEGCKDPSERVVIENDLRPKYMEYITLNAQGFDSNTMYANNMDWVNSVARTNALNKIDTNNPHFGVQFSANVYPRCSEQYPQAMAQQGYNNRMSQQLSEGYRSNQYRHVSGM
jgi:hypothetical protein